MPSGSRWLRKLQPLREAEMCMESRSPTLEGFKTMFWRPSFGLAEIAWRWSFDAAAVVLVLFTGFEYLETLPVSRGDQLLLKTRHPLLVSQAVADIFRGSSLPMMEAAILLALLLAIAWIIVAALGRAATLRALLVHFRNTAELSPTRFGPLFGLNFFRATNALAACIAFLGAFLVAYLVSPRNGAAAGVALAVTLGAAALVWLAWSAVNWFLSLASVLVVARGEDTFGSIFAAVDLCRSRTGSVVATGTWFGLAHLTAFVSATTLVALPLGLIGVVSAPAAFFCVLLISLVYLAIVDFLYIGRLAAYVAILELPEAPIAAEMALPPVLPMTHSRTETSSAVDPTELILGDVPSASSS
jgi:hypothetical protein